MSWYVVFKDGSETLTQTAEDKDEALLVACALFLRGKRILCVGPFGREANSQQEIEGAALRAMLCELIQK